MNSDISRDVFDARKHYSRVVMQQGRVLIDSDGNAAAAIQLHQIRQTMCDLVGPFAAAADGFLVTAANGKLSIGPGHCYVDGVLCENDGSVTYERQPDRPQGLPTPSTGSHLVYLDVWEREISCLDDPLLREVALGGPDTTTRTKVVWQVRLAEVPAGKTTDEVLAALRRTLPRLSAEAVRDDSDPGPCSNAPDARYHGDGNRLYRVEIHHGGRVGDPVPPTFKWSRDNAARAVFPIIDGGPGVYRLADLGRDDLTTLRKDDWVELTDEDQAVDPADRPLWKVTEVDEDDRQVTLSNGIDQRPLLRPVLVRWDQSDPAQVGPTGTIPVTEQVAIPLEDGITVTFGVNGQYRTGDHWLIPARVETGDVEWPLDRTGFPAVPALLPPAGFVHHLAPLARFDTGPGTVADLRTKFKPRFAP